MITSSWKISRKYVLNSTEKIEFSSPELLLIGMMAFCLLMLCELGMTVLLFQKSFDDFKIEVFHKKEGLLGLFGQLMFALIPSIQSQTSRRKLK
jgi:hypothetical protein